MKTIPSPLAAMLSFDSSSYLCTGIDVFLLDKASSDSWTKLDLGKTQSEAKSGRFIYLFIFWISCCQFPFSVAEVQSEPRGVGVRGEGGESQQVRSTSSCQPRAVKSVRVWKSPPLQPSTFHVAFLFAPALFSFSSPVHRGFNSPTP